MFITNDPQNHPMAHQNPWPTASLCLKAFSPQRRKDRKGRKEILACLLLLSVLSVLAVKILGFGFAGL